MTISYSAAGALAQGTATITPALPAGAAAGQLAVLVVVSGNATQSLPTTPSGWAMAASASGGSDTFGSGTGPRRVTVFVRELVADDTAPTTALPSGTGSLIAGQVVTLSRTAGTGWRWGATTCVVPAAITAFGNVCADALTWVAGDFVLAAYAVAKGTATLSAEGVTASGVTFGTITERSDTQVTAGDTARLGIATGPVTVGNGSQTPSVAATLSTASEGAAAALRIREASAQITVAAQTAFPPRNLISLTGIAGDDIVTATMYRQLGTDRTAVRAASQVDVTSLDALLRVDAEQPFGVPVTYAADLIDVAGTLWTLATGEITSTVDADVVSDAVTGTGALVHLESPWQKARDRSATAFNVGGRMVVVSRARSGASATVTVRTETDADGDDLDQVLQTATEGVVQIRKQTSQPRLDGHYAVMSDTQAPRWYDGYTWWTLETVEVQAWADTLEAAGFTLQDIADAFPGTLQDIADAFPGTLLDIALYDFGAA